MNNLYKHLLTLTFFALSPTTLYGQGSAITWTDLVGTEVQTANALVKTAAWGTNNGGAASTETLAAGTDGWAEFTAYATGSERYFGFSQSNTDATNVMDYAIKLSSTNTIVVQESGNWKGGFGSVADGDVLRIERIGGTVTYKKNGTTFYTSATSSTTSLLVDVCFYHTGGEINGAIISAATPTQNGAVDDAVEIAALQDLYQSSGGTTWTNNSGWPTDWSSITSVDQITGWYGITTTTNGDVTAIDLNSNGLSGTIPTSLNNLTALTVLRLHINQLTGGIPDLSGLTQLEELYLSKNPLGGTIPTWITGLVNLRQLSFEQCQLTGGLPSDIGNLTNLETLVFRVNSLTGSLPASLNNLTNLIHLRVDVNQLSGTLPDLGNLTSLQLLDLNRNQFTGSIPAGYGSLSSLKYMRLWSNQLSGTIPATLGNLNQLDQLHLHYNNLTGAIPSSIGLLPNLQYLYLNNNQLDGSVPAFSSTSKVKQIQLSSNEITSLPDLKLLSNLLSVDITGNRVPFQDIDKQFTNGTCAFEFTYADQEAQIYQETTQNITFGATLEINTNDNSTHNTYLWEKEESGSWIDVTSQNESTDPSVFRINNINPSIAGTYRYTITNDWATSLIITSAQITVTVSIGAPANLQATATDFDKIQLQWDGTSGISYEIQRSTTSGSGFTTVATTSSGAKSYTDNALTASTTYYYRIRATYGAETSPYTAEVSAQTKAQIATNADLAYKPQYNGNISAIKWKSHGDTEEKLYTYHYDPMNRIEKAQYVQGTTDITNTWTTTSNQGGFSVNNIAYDLNGNIQNLNRQSIGTDFRTIDALTYTYINGNQLSAVADAAGWEGFADKNPTGPDYEYDANGNMTKDRNKEIASIEYNHLNLPAKVIKTDGQYIKYIYDAAGIKLAQEVYDASDNLIKKTEYIGEFIYETDENGNTELQLIQHEEGRIVEDPTTGDFEYQYHLKDHLGNTRLTFTTKPKTLTFPATFESEKAADEEALYTNIAETRVTFNSADATASDIHTTGDNEVVRVNGTQPMGAGISLPVAAGDEIDMEVYGYYEGGTGYSTQVGLTSFIAAIAGGFGGVNGGTVEQQATYNSFDNALNDIGLLGTSNDSRPAAYLNYILFDEHMQFYQHGHVQIGTAANGAHEKLMLQDIVAEKAGFVYVYISSESAATHWVYFDDMMVTLNESPVIQEDDYYPFGLTFNGYQRVTAKENRYLYNGKEKQDALGIDWLDYGARMYMPEIGRFGTQDRFAEKYYGLSPYQYTANNPINLIDINGDSISVNIVKGGGKNGRDLYQIHVTGKVLDNTTKGLSDKKLNRITKRISKQIEKSFDGKDKNIEFETTTDITVADANNPLQSSDHAFRVVDDVATEIGATTTAGTQIDGFAEASQNYILIDRKSPNISRTAAHEFGHSAGLGHPKDEINPATGARYTTQEQAKYFPSNLMHQSRDPNSGTKINSTQVRKIEKLYSIGALNRGKQKK